MTAEHATFGLAPATRAGGVLSNGVYQAHRDFLDFIVDGRPLLLRIADLDAVSPLAADLGPSILTAQVGRLLLESDAPPPDSRYVIYGCPECAGPECGAVTAVIERDGEDYVWRDFAWQTDAVPDLDLNGYPGIGPFRFRGEQYRAELERLLENESQGAAASRRVLLIGRRAAVLAKLAAALRGIGIGAEITQDAAGAAADELRTYGAVAFGHSIGAEERDAAQRAFAAAGSGAVFVDGLAPIIPLLVAQIEQALDRGPQDQRRLVRLEAAGGEAVVTLTAAGRVRLTAYRLDRLGRAHSSDLFDGPLEPGSHGVALNARDGFVVARSTGSVLVAAVTRG
ncbi:oxidoreductase [Streptomyces sp. H27-D2]|uniref:oxidoreductase n=1 Tax=Streptomyces sp. H27-D2 TaxID=3046304 RepID=UPI002DBBDAA9|nr:oxidoreductase [Streptomyces sp. H27-D2]MEC4017476.1 oxidoreductase [Streptomyces sp. H27-D2]